MNRLVAEFVFNLTTRECYTWYESGLDYDDILKIDSEVTRIISTDLHDIYYRRFTCEEVIV